MGIYVITGGSSGIGAKTVEILKEKGHQVVNIDLKGGDIDANLATKEGRKKALDALHRQFPDGDRRQHDHQHHPPPVPYAIRHRPSRTRPVPCPV